ncbi:VP4 [Butcherbird polyomavirus]|uniref:VP4 n=1 Tax=Butcherbird polyomavirus TaxID=1394033 RepID=V5K7D9_9POLY|nr:VP4 [Butcherbird polyomavirus]AGU68324.1 VP4 [Butcherbird polyomavirus]
MDTDGTAVPAAAGTEQPENRTPRPPTPGPSAAGETPKASGPSRDRTDGNTGSNSTGSTSHTKESADTGVSPAGKPPGSPPLTQPDNLTPPASPHDGMDVDENQPSPAYEGSCTCTFTLKVGPKICEECRHWLMSDTD